MTVWSDLYRLPRSATYLRRLLALLLLLLLPAVARAQFGYSNNPTGLTITGTGATGMVNIPSTINGTPVTAIAPYAFSSRKDITKITIPFGVTSIGNYAFGQCQALQSANVPDTVTNINPYTFYLCDVLASVTISTNLTRIGYAAFAGCTNLAGVQLSTGLTSIDDSAFEGLHSLTNVVIPNGVTNLGLGVFMGCLNLTNVALPATISSIGSNMFYNCNKLVGVQLGTNITSIKSHAFYSCYSLPAITIPPSVTNIEDYVFTYCNSLTAINVDPLNPRYQSIDGVLFSKGGTKLIQYPLSRAASNYTIPNTVTNIGIGAFSDCTVLDNVTIPIGITLIASNAFSYFSPAGIYFKGNAPSPANAASFTNGNSATFYYPPGNFTWTSPFAGHQAFPWDPKVQTNGVRFGVRTNRFGFDITASSALPIVVEACTNFSNPTWVPVRTNTLINNATYFTDALWTNYPHRYYRLRSP